MTKTIVAITKNFINLLYPLHCAICKKALEALDERGVCDLCISDIRMNPRPNCDSCGRPLQNAARLCPECQKTKFHFDKAYSVCLYEGALKELIRIFKYNRKLLLSRILSSLIIDFVKNNGEALRNIDAITFVPLQRNRLRERGFNQSRVLAAYLSKEFGVRLADMLEKTRSTRHQNELSRENRLVNLVGAFRIKKGTSPKDLSILLIDDVMTTGATLNECSKALRDAGARNVRCLTLARGA